MWRTEYEKKNSKKIAEKIAKQLNNYEESVVRKRKEPDNRKLMNSPCRRVLQYQLLVLLKGLEYATSWRRNLSSKLYDGNSEVFYLGNASRKIPSGLQLSDRRVREHTCPTLTMSWVKEVATAKDDLMTSQSIERSVP